jgi:penicillin-binding protein 1C
VKPRYTYLILAGWCILFVSIYWNSIPDPLFDDPFSTVLEDRNGNLMGARIAADGQWRFPSSDVLPKKFTTSLLLYEDRYFNYHPGVNPFSLIRATLQNIRNRSIVSGGSTITMQLIRLSRKGKSRTIREKLIEIILATRLELSCTKGEILALYGGHAPFGGNVVGIDAAAWRYYGRSPENLSWAETATLAVLPNSPALIHPGRNREALLNKRNLLLDRLHNAGYIDSLTCQVSKIEKLPDQPLPLPMEAPHLLDYMYQKHKGQLIRSTLDSELQNNVSNLVEKHHKNLSHNEIHNIACLVLETGSGNVLAYIGNSKNPGSPEHGSDVDIIMSNRSTGSILKPVLFALMLEEGDILPGTLVPDIPTQYTGYSPKNFSLSYDGVVPARRALARSLNIPAVRMLQSFGLEKFHFYLKELGFNTLFFPPEHYGLSLILGGAEGRLWEICGIYASMGRMLTHYCQSNLYYQEDFHSPNFLLTTPAEINPGNNLKTSSYPLSASSIWLTFQSLIEVNRPETQSGWKSFSSSEKIAWKTGTSFGFRDAWAIGTTPEFTVGVWAGNADGEGRPGLTGIASAAPLLFDVFGVLPETTWFGKPENELFPALVCRQSGHLPGPHCSDLDTVLVTEKGLLSSPCPYHKLIHLSPDGRFRVNDACMDVSVMQHESWFILPPVEELYYRSRNPSYRIMPDLHPNCSSDEMINPMDMIYPRHSARVYVPFELDGSRGELILEAAHRIPSTLIHWHLDQEYIGNTQYIHQVGIRPEKGEHILTLVDEKGNTFVHHFEIIDR